MFKVEVVVHMLGSMAWVDIGDIVGIGVGCS